MRRVRFLLLGLAVLTCLTPAWAGPCSQPFSALSPRAMLGPTLTPREAERRTRDNLERISNQTFRLTGITGRHLSAVQTELRRVTMIIDAYLYIGDIGPIINRYNPALRRVEMAFLDRRKNLEIIKSLQTYLSDPGRLSDRAAVVQEMSRLGILSQDQQGLIETGSAEEIGSLFGRIISGLQKENIAHEAAIGREFEIYRIIRGHLDTLMGADDKVLLALIESTDSRTERSAAIVEMPKPPLEGPPGSLLHLKMQQKRAMIKERLEKIDKRLAEVGTWIDQLNTGKEVDAAALREFLEPAGYLNDALRATLSRGIKTEEDHKSLLATMDLLRDRLRDAKLLVEKADKVDNALGLELSDFKHYKDLFPEEWLRPTVKELEDVFYNSAVALRAKQIADRRQQVLALLDSTLFYGFAGSLVPAAGRAANVVALFKSEAPRNFVYTLFRDLYEKHVVDQHYPALNILRKAPGNAKKLRDLLEDLNGGTRDELLLTFARRADMRELWEKIKGVALEEKDRDHLHLYDRMLAAEKQGGELGTISIIDQTSYMRYFVSSIINGTLLFIGGRWVAPHLAFLVPSTVQGKPAVPAAPEDDKKKKDDKDKDKDKEEKEKPAKKTGLPPHPQAGDEQTEIYVLQDAEKLIQAAYQDQRPSDPDTLEAAALRLMAVEGELTGVAVE